MKFRHIVLSTALMFAAFSCKQVDKDSDSSEEESSKEQKEEKEETENHDTDDREVSLNTTAGKGGIMLGGNFTFAMNEQFQTLYPYDVVDLNSAQIVSQIFEGLLTFNTKSLEVEPSLAEKWEVSDDLMTYTFHLKKDVYFHDDPCFEGGKGRVFNADDVIYSFERLATKNEEGSNSSFENSINIVEGAQDFFNGKAKSISGLKKVDDYTVEVKITEPRANFIYTLATAFTSIVPKEAFEKYGKDLKVGTGPFMYTNTMQPNDGLALAKNPNYHRVDEHGNQLPYLDTIKIKYINSISRQLRAFEEGELMMITEVPGSKASDIVQENIDEYKKQPPTKTFVAKPTMGTQYYEFNLTKPIFKDVRVRKAFNYAIDREKIVQNVLSGQANTRGQGNASGLYGITPPVDQFEGYDFEAIKEVSYSFNPAKAKELMAEAGYPNGEGFPTLRLVINSGGTTHNRIVKEVVKHLERNLGITVNYEVLPFKQKIESAKYAKADMYRSAWVVDYPSPESFLLTLYGKNVPSSTSQPSYPNTPRYKNAEYDALLEKGMKSANKVDQFKYFADAEKLMMEEAPLIILWYVENYKMYHSFARNIKFNEIDYLDLSNVYLKKWTEEEWSKVSGK